MLYADGARAGNTLVSQIDTVPQVTFVSLGNAARRDASKR